MSCCRRASPEGSIRLGAVAARDLDLSARLRAWDTGRFHST